MSSISSLSSQSNSIEQLVQQYMAVERQPINDLELQKAALNTKSAVFNDLKNKLTTLYNAADDLADTTNNSIFESVTVSSSDTDKLTVTTDTNASQGEYTFRIRQLATATTMRSTAVLNSNPSAKSSIQVAAGSSNTIDTDEAWEDAGFDNTPDGTVTINSVEFTLADYDSVDDFMDAVNDDATANANIYYDDDSDKFIIESTDGNSLVLSENGTTTGFLTEINISTGTHSSNNSGIDTSATLADANFDTAITSGSSGSFKINGATIEWDADEDTLAMIIANINASDAGVTAFYDDSLDRVVFTSDETGSEEIEWEDVEGSLLSDTLNLSEVTQSKGQNALFTINSTQLADEITKSSNEFTINGLNFNLKEITVANDSYDDAETTSVTVSSTQDDTAVKSKINTLLNSFNSVMDYFKAKTKVDPTTYTRGALAGESVISSLKNNILGYMLGDVDGLDEDNPSYLAEIGITLDDSMHASISDSTDFSDWLNDDPNAVSDLFNSTNGIAAKLVEFLEPYTESYGILDDRKDSITDQIDLIEDRIDRLEDRMDQREAYYRQQFTSLQDMLNTLTLQQSTISNLTNSVNSALGIS